MSDIVMVHGTTQTSAGFEALAAALRARGHRPYPLDIPSGAADSAAGYAGLLTGQLPAGLDRPVVFAHSAAGLLLPALAQRLQARLQIWFAAAVADRAGRRSFQDEIRADPLRVAQPEWVGVDPADPVAATYFLFHDAGFNALTTALATVAVCDLSAVYEAQPVEDPTLIPSVYLLPVDDRCLRPEWMREIARDRLHVEPVDVPGGHNSYVAFPTEIAGAIDAAITEA